MFASLISWGGGRAAILQWLRPPQGAWIWTVLAIAVRLIPLPIFLPNWQLLRPTNIWLLWLAFALLNPWLEEGYWRGLLLDAAAGWPSWLGVLYSSILFALNHPLTLGVNSIANRHPVTAMSTFIMGLACTMK